MRLPITIAALFVSAAWGQGTAVSSAASVDINGRRVQDGPQVVSTKSDGSTETTERMQSLNGRMVPLEKVEERVLRDDASGRVVERIIRRYDQTGNPTTPVRQTIEEQKRPDGSSSIQTTTYQGDINGRMQLSEKRVTEIQKTASGETAETVVQRMTVNGSLRTVEKQSKTVIKEPNGYREENTISRDNGSGGFGVAVRRSLEHTQQGSETSDNSAEYEIGSDGRLALHSQTVAKTVKNSDGSVDQVVNLYGLNVPGTVSQPSSGLKLQEQQLIQTRPLSKDLVVETTSVRRPTASDPNTLGPARQISEVTCKGKCQP